MGKTLFILGAGFTKAFIDEAFMLVDQSHVGDLPKKYSREYHPYACDILEYEIERGVDIERLMKRLHTFMPHDFERKSTHELDSLYHDLKDLFVTRLKKLKDDRKSLPAELIQFAQWCINNDADCISLNYDDFLDHALWSIGGELEEPSYGKYWHPNSGYGFFCRPASTCIWDHNILMRSSSMILLKLHGSINWRIKLGASDPYQVDSILHFGNWYPPIYTSMKQIDRAAVEKHLDPKCLIVLPVLLKSDLVQQPVLRRIWTEAYNRLIGADRVIFIGYSMPRTDIATGFLFGEALRKKHDITVVNYIKTALPECEERDRNSLISAYQSVIPALKEDQFNFKGALPWINQNLKN
jgi:hypothetical protein